MDNFLKKTITNYLLKTDDYNIQKWNSNVKNGLCRVASLYNIDLESKIERNIGNSQLFNLLQDSIKNNTFTSGNSLLRRKIRSLANIYSLTDNEYNYLLFYICKNQCSEFEEFIDSCISFSGKYFAGNKLFNISSAKAKKTLDSLHQKGLIDSNQRYHRASKYEICDAISDVLEDDSVLTENEIKHVLLGKTQKAELKWEDYEHIQNERDRVASILQSAMVHEPKGINILLYGDVGTGKTEFAKMIANHLNINLYAVSCEDCNKDEANRVERLADLRSKQTILSIMKNSCILFDEAEDVMLKSLYGDKFHSKAFLNTIIENTPVPILWTTNNIYNVDPAILRRMTYTIQFEKLSEDTRLNIWKNILKKNQFKVEKNKLIELNRKYEISPSIISNAVKTTKLIGGTSDDFSDFIESVTQVVKKKKNVQKKADFDMSKYNDSLVNADLDVKDLTEKIQACGNLNFSLCLYGEPGTGKSLYAKYLANRLGLECIHKRVSDLMSKWVGETEQNIADAFAEARSKKAMLIFDEADSFLQTRGNAQRSWEISQVNEMLTQMETHEYPFVCTTNLLDTLDEASLRRFTFKIKFDFMTKEQVNTAFEDFFGVKNANVNIKGLTAGDFATVSKKANFLKITDKDELIKMLNDEVKVKKSESLKCAVGF